MFLQMTRLYTSVSSIPWWRQSVSFLLTARTSTFSTEPVTHHYIWLFRTRRHLRRTRFSEFSLPKATARTSTLEMLTVGTFYQTLLITLCYIFIFITGRLQVKSAGIVQFYNIKAHPYNMHAKVINYNRQ